MKCQKTDSSVSQSQAVLPNTGIQGDRTTGTVGVLSLLGAFGLLFAKKEKKTMKRKLK